MFESTIYYKTPPSEVVGYNLTTLIIKVVRNKLLAGKL
jgi:hypothetical protein